MGATSPSAKKDEVIVMVETPAPTCTQHRTLKRWQPTTFQYDEDGVSISVPNVYAWVCPEDGEPSFTAETTDELLITIRELMTPAKHARERRTLPTEYIVKVA
jgi:hypothetical protein